MIMLRWECSVSSLGSHSKHAICSRLLLIPTKLRYYFASEMA
jgi:hypothetical protein